VSRPDRTSSMLRRAQFRLQCNTNRLVSYLCTFREDMASVPGLFRSGRGQCDFIGLQHEWAYNPHMSPKSKNKAGKTPSIQTDVYSHIDWRHKIHLPWNAAGTKRFPSDSTQDLNMKTSNK
jgi:hypothetical protein